MNEHQQGKERIADNVSAALASAAEPHSPKSFSFTLPMPPSANALFKNVRGIGRVKTKQYNDFRQMGVVAIKRQNVPSFTGNVMAVIGVERMSGRADIDNRVKALLDTIVEAEVIPDDNRLTAFAVSWLPKANGLAHVTVFDVSELSLAFYPSQDGASGGWFVNAPLKELENGNKPF